MPCQSPRSAPGGRLRLTRADTGREPEKPKPPSATPGSYEKEVSPHNYVGDVIEATETDDGPAIKGRFDLDVELGKLV